MLKSEAAKSHLARGNEAESLIKSTAFVGGMENE
jgi:hypothetical protein